MMGRLRKMQSMGAWAIAFSALLLVVALVIDILVSIVGKGASGLQWSVVATPTSGIAGGLQNAILGTLLLVVLSTLVAGPIGVLGGVYVAIFARRTIGNGLRFFTEILAGVPSIVIGYFGYTVMVVRFGWGFSAAAASISLAILTVPYILRTTEASLRQVPKTYLEGALALGLTPATALRAVLFRPALPGILTGLLLSVSIGLGETAPLLYTANWSNFNPTLHLIKSPVGYLTYVVYTYLDEPYPAAHQLAYTAALVLVLFVLALHLLVRIIVQRTTVR